MSRPSPPGHRARHAPRGPGSTRTSVTCASGGGILSAGQAGQPSNVAKIWSIPAFYAPGRPWSPWQPPPRFQSSTESRVRLPVMLAHFTKPTRSGGSRPSGHFGLRLRREQSSDRHRPYRFAGVNWTAMPANYYSKSHGESHGWRKESHNVGPRPPWYQTFPEAQLMTCSNRLLARFSVWKSSGFRIRWRPERRSGAASDVLSALRYWPSIVFRRGGGVLRGWL